MSFVIRRSVVVALLAALALALLPTVADRAAADDHYSCTVEAVDGDALLRFAGTRGDSENLRQDGSWRATVTGLDELTVAGGADSAFEVRVRGATFENPYSAITCVDAVAPPPPPPPPPDGDGYVCTVEAVGGDALLRFGGERGDSENLRRNDRWAGTVTGLDEKTVIGGAGDEYVVRVRGDGFESPYSAVACTEDPVEPPPPPPPPPPATGSHVVHISVDGLRSDRVTPATAPEIVALTQTGASTLNARNDPVVTKTLPNHTSQLTGRPVSGPDGHGVTVNQDNGGTVHEAAGEYVASAFDVVHDHGLETVMFVSKSKFALHDRTWGPTYGAPDTTGADDGRDKIDVYDQDPPANLAAATIAELTAPDPPAYLFVHLRTPDEVGHVEGWASPAYDAAVTETDALVGDIADAVAGDPALAASTTLIVTSDHGGPTAAFLHDDPLLADNYTIPFVVWGAGAAAGADLYALNAGTRTDPGTSQPPITGGSGEPVRGHDVANLALRLLGLPAVPGSVYGATVPLATECAGPSVRGRNVADGHWNDRPPFPLLGPARGTSTQHLRGRRATREHIR